MKTLLLAAMILCLASAASAESPIDRPADKCPCTRYEFAELQSMSTQELNGKIDSYLDYSTAMLQIMIKYPGTTDANIALDDRVKCGEEVDRMRRIVESRKAKKSHKR